MITRTKRASKRSFAAVIAAALVASVLALVASPAGAAASVTATTRLSGADRYATANKVANPAGTTVNQGKFVLVSGQSYADGLAAAGLAGAVGGAMLLTEPDQLTTSVQTTMSGMASTVAQANRYVWIVGGTNAVKPAVVTSLVAAGWNVTRIAGTDRYATADAVAGYIKTQNGGNIGTMGGYRTCFLANGNGYADALAASGEAFDRKLPIFLTDGVTLSAGTSAAMASAKCQKVTVLGGTAAVSDAVKAAALAVSTVVVTARVSGADRYATATAMADETIKVDATRKVKALLVDGRNFPDGLAAAQYAAAQDMAIILTSGDTLPSAVSTWMTARQATLTTIATVGGTSAVPAAAVTAAKNAATKAGITATISKATDAATGFTVTFSARVTQASAQTKTNYTIVNKYGVGRNVTDGATITYTWTAATGVSKAVITGDTALAPGDVVTVGGNVIAGYADNNVKVATTSASVTANAAVPTAVITAYPGAADAATKVWVAFNMAVTGFAANGSDLTVTDAVAGGTASSLDTCALIANTTTYACHVAAGGEALAAGDTVTLAAGKVTSTATTAVKNTAASAVVAADTTKPTLLTASYSTPTASTAQANQAFTRVIGTNTAATGASGGGAVAATKGDVKIQVLAGSALAGSAGNAVKVDITGVTGATTCSYNSTTKVISINVAVTVLAPVLADLCNAEATMKDLFIATSIVVAADYALAGAAASTLNAGAGTLMLGGKDTFKVTLTFSEPLALAAASNFNVTTNQAADNTPTEAINAAAGAEELQELSGVIVLDVTSGTKPSAGLDKVTVSGNVDDRNANRLDLTLAGNPHIVFMAAGG